LVNVNNNNNINSLVGRVQLDAASKAATHLLAPAIRERAAAAAAS
jgi:hypothetical protein